MNNIPNNLLQTCIERFSNRLDVYGIQWANGSNFGYKPIRQLITIEIIKAHLAGTITLGFYAIDKNNNSKWLCFDSDTNDGQLDKLAKIFQEHGWHTIREGKRRGRDGHLWLFFDKPVPAIHLRQLARLFLRKAGIAENHFEFFPKQDQVTDVGSLVRLPLGIHRKPGADNAMGWFAGVAEDIASQLNWFCSQPLNSTDRLLQFVEEIEARELISKKPICKLPLSKSLRAKIDWIAYAKAKGFNSNSSFWHGRCPACKLKGHDQDNNHLWISNTGAVGCWRDCTFHQIVQAVRSSALFTMK